MMDEKKGGQTTFRYQITKNIELHSTVEHRLVERPGGELPLVELAEERPLVILLTWLNAKPRHVDKFVRLYFSKGFDVLTVSLHIWQILWPESGSHVVATDLLEFLLAHDGFKQILAQGFSVGAYLWSEALVKMEQDQARYRSVMDRLRGQIIDSPPASPPSFQKGFANALFPNNSLLGLIFQYLLTLQLMVFHNKLTKHIVKAYHTGHYPPINVPSLMFFSKDDPISPFNKNMGIVEAWKSKGVQTYMKWWEESPHVGHFVRHTEEYLDHLDRLLDAAGFPKSEAPTIVA